MKNMSDELLIATYYQAVSSNLSAHFISLLKLELHRRSLTNELNTLSS